MAKFKIRIGGELPSFKLPVTFTCPDGKDATINMTVKHHSTNEMKERRKVTWILSASWPKAGIWTKNLRMKTFPGCARITLPLSWRCLKPTWPRLPGIVQKSKAGCLSNTSA